MYRDWMGEDHSSRYVDRTSLKKKKKKISDLFITKVKICAFTVHSAGALMHGIDVDIIPQDACRERLQGAESQIEVDNTLTCVKAQKQRNNLCQVDVGGPLACDRGDGYYELTGIYSQETGCLPTNQVRELIEYRYISFFFLTFFTVLKIVY